MEVEPADYGVIRTPSDPDAAGQNVVVRGGGQFAAEVAWFPAERGRSVAIAAADNALASDVGPHTTIPLFAKLEQLGVEFWLGCEDLAV